MPRVVALFRRQVHYFVAGIVAVIVRVPGMVNGLPYVRHPDEPINYLVTHRMVAGPTLLPHFYDYPSLQYDLQAAAHGAMFAVGRLFGVWRSSADLGLAAGSVSGNTKVMSSTAWLVGRGVTVMISVVGVLLVVRLAEMLCRSKWWALAAGVLAATSLVGLHSGFVITPDALAGTTATATLICLVSLLSPERVATTRRWTWATGVCLGLAVGAKYNNAALAVLVIAAIVIARPEVRPTPRQCLVLAGVAGATFVLTTPAVLFDTRALVDAVRGVLRHYGEGHAGAEGGSFHFNTTTLWSSEAPRCC